MSALDLARFGDTLLTGQIIPRESVDTLCTSQIPSSKAIFGMGCGSMIFGEGHRRWGYRGGEPGIGSILAIYPDQDLVLAVLTNHESRARPFRTPFDTALFSLE